MKRITILIAHVLFSLALAITVLAEAPKVEVRHTPFNAVQVALADIATVAALNDVNLDPTYMRYLSLHNIPKAKRQEVKELIDFTLNSLNTKYRSIVVSAPVPAGTDDLLAVRVNLLDYGIDPVAWDNLAEKGSGPVPIPDPYFHEQLVKIHGHTAHVTETVTYQPQITHKYAKFNGPTGYISIELPNTANLYIDGTLITGEGNTRAFKTPALVANREYHYTVRAEILLDGKTVVVEKQIPVWGGWETRVAVEVIKTILKVEKAPLVVPKPKKERFLATASWLALEDDKKKAGTTIAELIKFTNTKNPVLRADWFITYATWAPAYYNLIGLKLKDNPDPIGALTKPKVFLEKDFENLFKFRFKDAKTDIVGAITDTKIVTLHNRIIQRFSTVVGTTGGYYWRSQDTDKGIDDEDYLNDISVFDKAKIKAQEIIASARNGLNFYALTNDKGVLLDLAVASIAIHGDNMPTKLIDKQVYSGRNCMFCHAGGQLYIKDKVRNIASKKIALFINDKTTDPKVAKKILETFSPDTKNIVDLDNAKFLAAVKSATTKDGKIIGKALEELIQNYHYQSVTLEKMAWEAGIDVKVLEAKLKKGVNIDYMLTSVIQTPPEDVSRLPWEFQGFAALMRLIYSIETKR